MEQKRGKEKQRFLKGGQAESRGGCLKKWAGTLLLTMIQFLQSSGPSLQGLKNLMFSEKVIQENTQIKRVRIRK